jgi:hypothetical protein
VPPTRSVPLVWLVSQLSPLSFFKDVNDKKNRCFEALH